MPTKSIFQAIATGDTDEVKLHIARGADLNKPDGNQNTPLGTAVDTGRVETVQLLVEAGANVAAQSRDVPPVSMAAIRGNADIVELLVARGANVNTTDAQGMTPLIAAAQSGHLDIIEFLVGHGADVNAKDKRGQTALSIAIAQRNTELGHLLRKHGAEEPVNMFDLSPYGSRGLSRPGATMPSDESGAADGSAGAAASLQILGDPDEIRARVAAFPGLAEAIAAVDANSASEERNWRQRRTDNRTMLVRSVEKQFEQEMSAVKGIGSSEGAVKTVAAVDSLVARRKARYDVIYGDLRDEKRAAMLEEREAATRTRSMGRSRGRTTTMDSMTDNTANDPYAARAPRPAPRARAAADANEPAHDAATESQLQAWLGVDPLDKRDLLNSVHALDLQEFDALRQIAAAEDARKTAATIEGFMLARQQRLTTITAKMVQEEERLQRIEERTGATMAPGTTMAPGATRGRAGRATTGQEDTTTQRRGRRYR